MQQEAENARMAKLYRELVLKEKQPEGFVGIESLLATANKPAPKEEEVGSFGD
jgi:hypothetical protein